MNSRPPKARTMQSQRETDPDGVAHTFNPSLWESQVFNLNTRKVETGRIMTRQREEYKTGENRSSSLRCCKDSIQSEDLWKQDLAHFDLW